MAPDSVRVYPNSSGPGIRLIETIRSFKFFQTSEAVMRGDKRPGAGRKPGSVSAAKTRLQQTAKDVAAHVLLEVEAVAVWKKLILQQEKPQVVAGVMDLTDRVYGRPSQTFQGNGFIGAGCICRSLARRRACTFLRLRAIALALRAS